MDLLKITGGEFTRQNGTLATMAAADWKPEAGLSFKDWNDNRLITDKPKDLIQLSLNRFFTDETGGNQSKIADAISLDLDEENKPAGSFTAPLDLSKYFAPEALEGRSAEYELIGIAVHQGSTIHSGHYVAYIKKGNQWYHISDSSSSKINESAVPFTQASVLTYHRL